VNRFISYRRQLMAGAALAAAVAFASPALAQSKHIEIAPQSLATALYQLGSQTGEQIIFSPELADSKMSRGVASADNIELALNQLLQGTGLSYKRTADAFMIVSASDPQSGSAAGDGADEGTVAALIVTAQKREEDIQDVPIAISAFTEKTLQEQKIEGGFDLLKAIPNVTFSKNNFTSYNFSIRGIGTKAVSATTDPGVAVSFNNIALLQNRLFEQEYFDVERVEVLRGPQGTLYGRNATAGVINVISAKPNLQEFDGWVKGEVGNYHSKRASAMVNIPLVEDKLAVRLAGSFSDRQGYDYNEGTHHAINGRDLWSTRLTLAFNPTDHFRTNLVWERFNEDDDRSRTGKQLCHRDPGKLKVGDADVVRRPGVPFDEKLMPALFSQGCLPGNLYEDAAFGTPNGLALPFVFGQLAFGTDCGPYCNNFFQIGAHRDGTYASVIALEDPYRGMMQSRDLRNITSFRDPKYRAKADVVELNMEFDLSDQLTVFSQTAYNKDTTYSFQDYNRFNTGPVFEDTAQLTHWSYPDQPSPWADLAPGGVFCDPQLGCSNTMAGFDIAQAKGAQFTQEIRLQSNFDGPLNFSAGANYTRFETLIDYYVFFNLITAYARTRPFSGFLYEFEPDQHQLNVCARGTYFVYIAPNPVPAGDPRAWCPYIDPNPIESINGDGHNYFRSKNPYKLKSWATFGEVYYNISDALKVTAGLRYTDDRKTFIPVPSQVLLAPSIVAGGTVSRGYPEDPPIKQHWGEWTGRLVVDWKPELSFTDDTLLYASYSRGYKGGGANPPSPGFATAEEGYAMFLRDGFTESDLEMLKQQGIWPVLELTAVEYGPTFDPEFVDAVEVGAKNTLMGGALTFNTDAFYYNYKDYQVSQIRDRTAVNENFDATAWGLEFQTMFSPSRDFQVIANLGYLDTKIADGETSIDIMNRTQSNPDYVLVRPWSQMPSNCVIPTHVAEWWLQNMQFMVGWPELCGGVRGGIGNPFGRSLDSAFNFTPYDYHNYPELNGGAGLKAQLGGNELPNAPHWTMNIGAQYGFDLLEDWRMTIRGDAYWQSQSWARVYNDDPYDKLHGWYNVNLSVWFERPDDDLKIEFYAKNLLDKTPITDAFLNSDDTALTTNVFVLDPRLIGLSIRKGF